MIETLKTLLITIGGYGAAMLTAGCIVGGIAWLLQEERWGWSRTVTMLILFGLFIIYPAILLIQSFMSPDPSMPYDDNPYHENIYDRYN